MKKILFWVLAFPFLVIPFVIAPLFTGIAFLIEGKLWQVGTVMVVIHLPLLVLVWIGYKYLISNKKTRKGDNYTEGTNKGYLSDAQPQEKVEVPYVASDETLINTKHKKDPNRPTF